MEFSGESIYNLVPRNVGNDVNGNHHTRRLAMGSDGNLYRSKHNACLPPSYSTFGVQGTVYSITNASGTNLLPTHAKRFPTTTRGASPHKSADAAGNIAGRDGASGGNRHDGSNQGKVKRSTKPPIPTRDEKPIMGLKSDKNFVIDNAVESILAVPRRRSIANAVEASPAGGLLGNALAKPDYGKVPPYLRRIQNELDAQKRELQAIAVDGKEFDNHTIVPGRGRLRKLTPEEMEELQTGLRNKWKECNKAYQTLSFSMETLTQIKHRESIEQELKVLEDAIKRFSKRFLFVYDDMNVA